MKKVMLQEYWVYEDLSKVIISNNMANMIVNASPDDSIKIEGMISIDEPIDDFEFSNYITREYSNGELTLEFDDIDEIESFGRQNSRILLSIPTGTSVEVEIENYSVSLIGIESDIKVVSENGAVSISNIAGNIDVESENGPVRINSATGSITAKLENGGFSAEDITGEEIDVESENGSLKVRLAQFKNVNLITENGPIYYETKPIEGGDFTFKTENGIVHLVLPINFGFKLKAESESGRLKSNLDYPVQKQDENVFRIEHVYDEESPTTISIETENGMIKLSSDTHIDLDYVKSKIEKLKLTLNVQTEEVTKEKLIEEKEKALELINKVIEYLTKTVRSINEEKIQKKVYSSIAELKNIADNFDFDESRSALQAQIEDIGTQVYDGIREGLKNVKAEYDGLKYEHLNANSLKEYIHKVVNSPLIKPYLGAELKQNEKDEVAERSRIKILEMLEAGKITSEEAEKLLKAISKEYS